MVSCLAQYSQAATGMLSIGMDNRISMSISGDSLLNETLNGGPNWHCMLLRQQYKIPFRIIIVKFAIFFFFFFFFFFFIN